jgi:hypothetical protein
LDGKRIATPFSNIILKKNNRISSPIQKMLFKNLPNFILKKNNRISSPIVKISPWNERDITVCLCEPTAYQLSEKMSPWNERVVQKTNSMKAMNPK